MNKQSLMICLQNIKDEIRAGNKPAALHAVERLEVCIRECECDVESVDTSDYPAILREQAL